MAVVSSKADTSLPLFSTPLITEKRSDGDTIDPREALIRGRNERKSIVAERRLLKEDRSNSVGVRPQKSQSAGDLPSIRIRASASASFGTGNGTVPSGLLNITPNTRVSGIDPLSEKQLADNSVLTTVAKPLEPHRYIKADSAAALTIVSSSALQDLGTSMNVSDASVEGDLGRKIAHRERRFRRLFRNVPTTEVLLCRYSCAYVSAGLLLQGHMYVSNRWICFHSNVFGIEKIIEIPAESVTAVSKANTAKIIPNAVKIKTEGKSYLFGSLISRDNTYRLLVNVTSIGPGRDESGNSNKFDFTGGPYGNVSRTLRDCADEFDEVTSSSSSLSTETSTSSLGDGRPKVRLVRTSTPALTSGTVEEPEQVVWRRPLQSGTETQIKNRTNETAGKTKEKGKGNGLRKSPATSSSIPALLTWFFGLPKTLTILIICVGLVMFLFLCATILTIRLIYVRSSSPLRMDFTPWTAEDNAESILLSNQALDNMGAVLDNSLKIMDEVKGYLESLRMEVRNGLEDAATGYSTSSGSGVADESS